MYISYNIIWVVCDGIAVAEAAAGTLHSRIHVYVI